MNEVPISDRSLQHGNFTPGAEAIGKHGRRSGIAIGRFEHGGLSPTNPPKSTASPVRHGKSFWTGGRDYSIVRPQLSAYNLNRR